jgi:hypothetical protein
MKRQALLLIAIVVIVFPPLVSLFELGLPIAGVTSAFTKGQEIAFWYTVSSLFMSVVFPVGVIVAYLKWPRRLEPAYWIIPFYLGLAGVDGLLDVFIRWRIQADLGYAWVQSFLFLVFAFLLWDYRPGRAPAEVPMLGEELEAQPK